MPVKAFRASWILAAITAATTACGSQAESAGNSAGSDEALTPAQCADRNTAAEEAGTVSGASLVTRAWTGFDDCPQFALFEGIVQDNTARLTCQGSDYVVCRCQGYKEGVADKLTELKATCSDATTRGLATASAAPVALVPATCTGKDLTAYNTGWTLGGSLAAQAWKGCANSSAYSQAIAKATALVVPPAEASTYVACRLAGQKDGMAAKAQILVTTCAASTAVP